MQINSVNLQQNFDISLQNPPKVKNLAPPGSLPSGSGIRSNERNNRNDGAGIDNRINSKIRYHNPNSYDQIKDGTQNNSYPYQN
jgi:hypothetical protein